MKQKRTIPLSTDEGWALFKKGEGKLFHEKTEVIDWHEFHGHCYPYYIQTPHGVGRYTDGDMRKYFFIEIEEELKPLYLNVFYDRWCEYRRDDAGAILVKYIDADGNQVGEIEILKK